jgi:hypothetical protein
MKPGNIPFRWIPPLMARIDEVTKNRSSFPAKAAEEFLGSHTRAVS